ncbi:MAG: hypothetical protein R2828_34935 [Saprospiraceae bacterium]
MENQIIQVTEAKWKSILLNETELWLSKDKIKDFQNFERAVRYPGSFKVAGISYSLDKIVGLRFNESSDTVNLEYSNSEKTKKVELKFNDKEQARQFGSYLGEKLGFNRNVTQENRTIPLLKQLLYLIVSIGITAFLGTSVDSEDLNSSGGRKGGAILRIIYDTIGQTGILILGSLISIFLAYKLYDRYQNPVNDIIYEK